MKVQTQVLDGCHTCMAQLVVSPVPRRVSRLVADSCSLGAEQLCLELNAAGDFKRRLCMHPLMEASVQQARYRLRLCVSNVANPRAPSIWGASIMGAC